MWVPSAVGGVFETDAARSALLVGKSERTLSSGPKTTIATGRSVLRSARKARAAAIAFWIGAPFMLFEASMSRIAPLLSPPGGAPPRLRTDWPFSVTWTFLVVSACVWGSATMYALSGKPDVGVSLRVGAAAVCVGVGFCFWVGFCPVARAGRV